MNANFITDYNSPSVTYLYRLVTQVFGRGDGTQRLQALEGRHHHRETRRHDVEDFLLQHQRMTQQYAGYECCLHLSASQTCENTADRHLCTDNDIILTAY